MARPRPQDHALSRRVAEEVWVDHLPDDAGSCSGGCGWWPCEPASMAATALTALGDRDHWRSNHRRQVEVNQELRERHRAEVAQLKNALSLVASVLASDGDR